MKKSVAVVILALTLLPQTAYCRPDPETGYDVENGTVISYVGMDKYILVPAEQNGEKATSIGEKAFAGAKIESADIERGIRTIGKSAFEGAQLYSVTLPDTLENVGENAFADCQELSNITLVNTDVHFEKNAFAGTNYLVFWIDCQTGEAAKERLKANIKEAKGDESFDIANLHDYDFDESISAYVCKNCGDIMPMEDGRDPAELADDTDYDAPMDGAGPDKWSVFDDVAIGSWYCDYVNYAASNGIINGKSERIFAPDDNITVAEAIKLAACAYAQNNADYIEEKSGGNWYDKYVDYAIDEGIIEPHFTADRTRNATRAEVAYLFSRADMAKIYINDVPLTDIPDVDANAPYFREIQDMYNLGAAVGDADMSFRPEDNIKRSEAAAMIVRIIDYGYRIELPKG